MSRRREANRAEAIARGIGGIVMVILLWGMVKGTPILLRGEDLGDAIAGLLRLLKFFVGLFGVITIIGLVVWFKVLKGHRRPASNPATNQHFSRPSPRASALSCADCGTPITPGIANYCRNRSLGTNAWLVALLSVIKVKRPGLYARLRAGQVSTQTFFGETCLDAVKYRHDNLNAGWLKKVLLFSLMSEAEYQKAVEAEKGEQVEIPWSEVASYLRGKRTAIIPGLCCRLDRFSLRP